MSSDTDSIGVRFEHDYWTSRIPAWRDLCGHLAGRPGLRFLEVGSLEGRSAVWMLENLLTDPTSTLTCVDYWNWKDYESVFDRNIVASGRSRQVVKIKGASHVELRRLKMRHYDLIYLDGSHIAKDAFIDAALAWGLLKVGGIMVFDDYLWEAQDAPVSRPQMAIDAFLACFAPYLKVLQEGGPDRKQVFIEKTQDHIRRPELVRWGL